MDHPKEGSGESGMPPSASGAKLLKVKQEIGAKMRKGKKTAREAIATRVSKRKKKDDSSGSSPHSPSLLKNQDVVNLMVQALAQKELGRACNSDETPETAPEGWFCCHEKYISKSHLRFPLPSLLLDLLDHYQLALSQLCPSVIRVINGFITRSKEEGVSVGLTELMSLFSLKESASKEGGTGTYYLPSRPNHVIFRFSSSDDDWRKKYFYVKVDPSTVPVGRNLRLAGAVNRAQLRFENALCAAPNAGELAEVTEMVKAAKADLDQARVRISELEAEVTRLGLKADAQQGEIEKAARKIAEHQVRELIASSRDSQKNKEAEVKLAVREGKKEVAEAYGKILVCVKEKFARKKDEVSALVYAQELQANADLLKDMLNNKIQSVEEEYNQLVALLPEVTTAYEKAQVSDFSVSKLPLPQISESSGTFEINMINPSFSGEYGSNLGLMAPDLAPVEAAIGGDGNVVDEGVPAVAGDPIQEEKED
uniref:Transposase (putative) gypsy type domain-containing protein n=1 Tax=Brassica oleracea var. oleracea TaxID=109376 RepID=A0A0D3AMD9_BRAOL